MQQRVYQLKSPGKPGGLVPVAGQPVPVPVPVVIHQPSTYQAPTAPGIPVRVTGGAGAAPARGAGLSLTAPQAMAPAGASGKLLSKDEITPLAILAGKAFAAMCKQDPDYLPEMLAQGWKKAQIESEWRHGQVMLATTGHPEGIAAGLSKAKRSQYRTIQAHFLAIMGDDVASLNVAMRTGPAVGKAGTNGDSKEDIEHARHELYDLMERRKLNLYYVQTVCGGKDGTGGKFHTRNIESLTKAQLWTLFYTLTNRANQRDGLGNPDKRNKKQRRKA